jgi:hypothetical protein
MNNLFEHNLAKLRNIKLHHEEKAHVRSVLLEHIAHDQLHTSGFFTFISSLRYYTVPATLGILLVLGAGVLALAETAVPGDVTYTLKVDVTEPLRDALAISQEDQLLWDISKAERRQEEIEALATQEEI